MTLINDDPIPPGLIQAIAQNRVILFAGSGLSATANAPLWARVAEDLIQLAEEQGLVDKTQSAELRQERDLRIVADHLLEKFAAPDRARFFRDKFSSVAVGPIHKILSDLGIRRIITTNWDCMAEAIIEPFAIQHDPSKPWQNRWTTSFTQSKHDSALIDAARKGDIDTWVFHVHGVYYRPETIVWESSKFTDFLENHYSSTFLAEMLRDNVILYLGYSMEDSDFQQITETIARRQKGSLERHYAVMPNVPRTRKDALMRKGITAVSYSIPADPQPSDYTLGLERLLRTALGMHRPNLNNANYLRGRSNSRIQNSFDELIGNARGLDGAESWVSVYGSSGRDFLRDHEANLVRVISESNYSIVRLLLFDPRIRLGLPGVGGEISIHDWRQSNEPGRRAYSSPEFAEFRESLSIIARIRESLDSSGKADRLMVRFYSEFPRNTICQVGRSIFDCPRPVRKLSVQGPMFEYRLGSGEYDFFYTSFELMWEKASTDDLAGWGPGDDG